MTNDEKWERYNGAHTLEDYLDFHAVNERFTGEGEPSDDSALEEAARVETLHVIDRQCLALRREVASVREREYKQMLDKLDRQIDALHELREMTAECWEKWVAELHMAQEPN